MCSWLISVRVGSGGVLDDWEVFFDQPHRGRAAGETGPLPGQVRLVVVAAGGGDVGQRARPPVLDQQLGPLEPDDSCGLLGAEAELRTEASGEVPPAPADLVREVT